MKYIFISMLIFVFTLQANDVLKQKSILTVKNIIEKEEAIAYEFEKYLLNEAKIPSLDDLLINDYLGENFKLFSNLGDDISFKSVSDLRLHIAINNPKQENNFLKLLYKRELYRNYTSVSWDSVYSDAYVNINLQSDEAKNIFRLLKNGKQIATNCLNVVADNYCLSSKITIRWYDSTRSTWIEYNLDSLENSDIAISEWNEDNLPSKLSELAIGTKIYIKDNGIKLKIDDNIYTDVDL